ncbi:MAG: iron transporter substrate-binding protein [Hyphomicrobiales bacterium]|nr:iron transporter substrate-binding protein [Hyphomicrobiales bacterium]
MIARRTLTNLALAGASLLALAVPAAAQQAVNLYTTREPGLVRPLIEAFTKSTGVKVNTVFVKDGLAERVAAEGERSPADVLMAVDAGNLLDLVDRGVAQPVKSGALEAAVPANLRDPEGRWFALSMRARTVYAAKALGLKSIGYEDLADPKYKGKVCLRSGQHPYNTALIAAYIAHHGAEKAEAWLRGVKANLARKPSGGDREVARDILAGICEIGLGNSYYVGLMRSGEGGPDQKKWGDAIDVVLPTFEGKGTHVNVSGAAVAKNAPNREMAVKFMEWLVSADAQAVYANGVYEYPVTKAAAMSPIIAALGELRIDPLPLGDVVRNRKQASELVDKVGFDN